MRIVAWVIARIIFTDVTCWILTSICRHRTTSAVAALTFLSGLNRPSFVVDVQAIQRLISDKPTNDTDPHRAVSSLPIPPILLPASNELLIAQSFVEKSTQSQENLFPLTYPHTFNASLTPIDILGGSNDFGVSSAYDKCFGYIHCHVVKPSFTETEKDTVLAQLNVAFPWNEKSSSDGESTYIDQFNNSRIYVPAHLVLGLNNHHVISYYWARSIGSGAAMEVPGIVVEQRPSGNAQLRWASKGGFTECNSNDGKRSEWVNFLKDGDQVQLRPKNVEAAIQQFREDIYGISMAGRPLGSEPIVVCRWKIVPNS